MSPRAADRLSVIIVAYNSEHTLAVSLAGLDGQLRPDDELIVVDNASTDGSGALVRRLAPAATVVESTLNTGFAGGANAGARRATGDVLVFLNPDATPARGFADAIRSGAERGWSAWMGLVTAESGRIVNTNGGVVHFTGIAWAGEAGVPAPGSLAGPREVAFVSGACLAVPRAEWERAGGFAEAFFMYQEDVDLSMRLRLAGGRLGIEPEAVVDHDYEFRKGQAKWRLLERNRWAMLVRCYPGWLLVLIAPALLATEVALLVVAAADGWLTQKLLATTETARALPRLLRERRRIQATRTVSAGEFAAWLVPELNSAFLGPVARSRLVSGGLRLYWRLVLRALRHTRR